MEKTLTRRGKQTEIVDISLDDFSNRRWEIGAEYGVFNQDPVMSVYGGFAPVVTPIFAYF